VLFDADTVVAVRDALPEAVVVGLRYLTHLGDSAFLAVLVVLFYWFSDALDTDRETAAFVVAVGVGCLALSVGLKGVVARPRPPSDVALVAETGYSFPSAHALGATVVYVLLAIVSDAGERWQRFGVAGALVVVISASRVVIGVHYPGDVVAGVVVGVVYLAVVLRYFRDAERAFFLALVVALVGVALGSREYPAVAVGASAGGFVFWHFLSRRPPLSTSYVAVAVVCGSFGVVVAAGAFAYLSFVESTVFKTTMAFVGSTTATGGVLSVPYIVSRFAGRFDSLGNGRG
jgi:membrane-associated phospholipid phosphatase